MIDYQGVCSAVTTALAAHLGIAVTPETQAPGPYPLVSYAIPVLLGQSRGTWGIDQDRQSKPATQTWSISAASAQDMESVSLILKAYDWFDNDGTIYLNDRGITVQSLSAILNKDKAAEGSIEYKKGFEVVLGLANETVPQGAETIETVTLTNTQ